MHVTVVQVFVKPECIDEFIQATLHNHEASVMEPGNRRFDVLQSNDDPSRFTLYEAYDSEADAKAHKDTSHYATWRDAVVHMMAAPRQSVTYTSLAPTA